MDSLTPQHLTCAICGTDKVTLVYKHHLQANATTYYNMLSMVPYKVTLAYIYYLSHFAKMSLVSSQLPAVSYVIFVPYKCYLHI